MVMEGVQRRLESWIRDQKSKISIPVPKMPSFALPQQMEWIKAKWPPWSGDREQKKIIQEEYERRKKQLQDLCWAVKAESVADLQDILCCMVLSECVYKRPANDLIRYVNKFKADFGGQMVCLERVQPSLDHVPHRYLLAEAGDTLFASFVGTKEYKDVMTDVNIFQGAIFHEDTMEDMEGTEVVESDVPDIRLKNAETLSKANETKPKQTKRQLKPAVHRGFMARAKGIPALELYRLAQKKKRKLVLCGHSLGGAVAALATLAILRVVASSSSMKENEKLQVKCITFSQPPVGNAALRDYVDQKGWQHYFKTYCIPEDLVPRILSPAYFHHYNTQANSFPVDGGITDPSVLKEDQAVDGSKTEKPKDNRREQLVIGMGPVQTSFWRLSRLVPLEGVRRHIKKLKGDDGPIGTSPISDSSAATSVNEEDAPQSLEIQEDSDGVSLKPINESAKAATATEGIRKPNEKCGKNDAEGGPWRQVPYLPSYVPFGQLYLLGTSSVESLSDAEYSNLTSVKSVIAELRERLQSHSMRSYRSRFQRIYDLCMSEHDSFIGMEQLQQFPHLQQWLGLSVAGNVEFGHIVENPSIRTATSIAPLGWSGVPGDKSAEPLKVDITGFALNQRNLIEAQVNGSWCSTTVESFSSEAGSTDGNEQQAELQKMRILVGAPLRRPPKHQIEIAAESLTTMFPSINSESLHRVRDQVMGAFSESRFIRPGGLNSLIVYCTNDFITVSREVDLRTRRVRFVGLEGAGKTTLLRAILNQSKQSSSTCGESLLLETDVQEGVVGGLCYMDSTGINMQDLKLETSRFRDELWTGIRDLSRKIDLIVLVHNLAHKIPRSSNSNPSERQPALSLLLDEAKAFGVPWVLAITNKFSVSAHQQKAAIDAVLRAYQASPGNTEVLNSCMYVVHSAGNSFLSAGIGQDDSDATTSSQNPFLGTLNIVRRPFQRKPNVLQVEGVTSLCQLIHRVLRREEELAFEEFSKDRLLLEMARDRASDAGARKSEKDKALSAATVGASFGAGLGVVLAVVMGAASALRKP